MKWIYDWTRLLPFESVAVVLADADNVLPSLWRKASQNPERNG